MVVPKKSSASKAKAAKAGATVAAGGGPEDPIADVLALKALAGAKKAPKAAAQGTVNAVRSRGSKLLLTEFLVCFVILGAGTVVSPTGSKNGVPRLMTRGTGLCLLFFILALVAGGGDKAKKSAEALGGLVTVSYLVLSSDALEIFKWMTSFFGGAAAQAGQGVGDVAGAAAAQQTEDTLGANLVAQSVSGAASQSGGGS